MTSRHPQPLTRRPRKRHATPVLGGQDGSYKSINTDLTCPICFDTMDNAYMTKCGHSFCHDCIKKSLELNNRCPTCRIPIASASDVFPNFSLTELIRKQHRGLEDHKGGLLGMMSDVHGLGGRLVLPPGVSASATATATAPSSDAAMLQLMASQDWDLGEINNVMYLLGQRKQRLEQGSKVSETRMLKGFLEDMKDRKEKELEKVKRQLEVLTQDCKVVAETLREYEEKEMAPLGCPDHMVPNMLGSLFGGSGGGGGAGPSGSGSSSSRHPGGVSETVTSSAASSSSAMSSESFAGSSSASSSGGGGVGGAFFETTEARKRRKVSQHFEDLEQVYLSTRRDSSAVEGEGSLDQFATCLAKFSQYTAIRSVASLNYTHEVLTNSSSIVSSIEFDRDCEYFAIAGVTKKIKVFEYGVVREAVVDLHYPITEMSCASKISCIAWNPYKKQILSSADYDGTVYIWDTSTNHRLQMFQEHEKRCWSVDFNRMDPKLLASGSDDTKVKLWDWDRPHSVMTIEGGANVCCVKFNPTTRYNLAFGCADHCVHYYDLRNPKKAVSVFKGHGKAVSYVKFLNGQDMVSASTDSQLKLWSVGRQNAISTFKGHINEKNFVGLATDGDYIACGSEDNSLYVYYKGLSKHILTYKFDPPRRLIEKPGRDDDSSQFLSAVTWKPDSNILVAANSQGLVKLLELV